MNFRRQIREEDKATISKKAWKTVGSKMFIREGQQVSIKNLLQGIIVDSGNHTELIEKSDEYKSLYKSQLK